MRDKTVAIVLAVGLAFRLAFIAEFPTIPFSDFRALVDFGVHLQQHGVASGAWFWEYFNPGFPLILCSLFTIFRAANPDAIARLATALAAGIVPVIPLVVWRSVLPLGLRVTAGLMLALWPGQVVFSGVASQTGFCFRRWR